MLRLASSRRSRVRGSSGVVEERRTTRPLESKPAPLQPFLSPLQARLPSFSSIAPRSNAPVCSTRAQLGRFQARRGLFSWSKPPAAPTPPPPTIPVPPVEYMDAIKRCSSGDLEGLKKYHADLNRLRALIVQVATGPSVTLSKNSPLHAAAVNNKLDVIEYLVSNQIMSVDSQLVPSHFTPLHVAIYCKNAPAALLLLKLGASVQMKTPAGLAALGLAWQFGLVSVITCIRQILKHEQTSPNSPQGVRGFVQPTVDFYMPHNNYQRMPPAVYESGQYIDVLDTANPFPVAIMDCSHVAFNYITFSQDEKVTQTFQSSREFDGKKLFDEAKFEKYVLIDDTRQGKGQNSVNAAVTFAFPKSAQWWPTRSFQGPVFKAKSMADKWDIYRRDNQLLFVRSWSQFPAYRVLFTPTAIQPLSADVVQEMPEHLQGNKTCISAFNVDRIEWNGNIGAEDAIQQIDFLTKRYLLGLISPAPLPDVLDLSNESQLEAAYSHLFSTYGRAAAFTTKSGANYAKLYNQMTSLPS